MEENMSAVVRKISVVILALTLSLAAIGCGEEELTQEEIEKVVDNAAAANAEVDTLRFDMDMLMTTEVIAKGETNEITIVTDGAGAIDRANREMQFTMNITTDMPGKDEQMSVEFYAVAGWMYTKVDIPVIGEQWMKMRSTMEMWEAQSQIDQQVELLQTATEVNLLGSEYISGTECYVVELVVSAEAFDKLLSQQQIPGMEDINLGDLDLTDLFKEVSVKEWIAKDGYLLMKSEIHMLMEFTSSDLGVPKADLEKMTMDMNLEARFYNHNQAVSIELPEEALQAQEIPRS